MVRRGSSLLIFSHGALCHTSRIMDQYILLQFRTNAVCMHRFLRSSEYPLRVSMLAHLSSPAQPSPAIWTPSPFAN
jgi:hypothetical protein